MQLSSVLFVLGSIPFALGQQVLPGQTTAPTITAVSTISTWRAMPTITPAISTVYFYYLNSKQSSAWNSLQNSLANDWEWRSSYSVMARWSTTWTNQFNFYNTSIISRLTERTTATGPIQLPSIPQDVPAPMKTYYRSAWNEIRSVIISNATPDPTSTASSSSSLKNAAPREIGFVKAAGAAAAGALGMAAAVL